MGTFGVVGLMPGRYLVAAVPRDRLSMPTSGDTTLFEELSKVAIPVVLGEDEERRLDLRVVGGNGGQ